MSDTVTRTDRLKVAHEKLQEAVQSIVTGEDWRRMLGTAAKFHRYSFQNQLLIFCQRPDATLVAGFNKWKSLGRFVKKGEKGIAIFAPCKYRTKIEDDNGDEKTLPSGLELGSSGASGTSRQGRSSKRSERPTADGFQIRGFRIVYVFDIAQTQGDEIPDLDAVRPKLLDGDAPEGIWDALVIQANAAGFDVIRDRKRSENGYCDFGSGRIGIRPDVEDLQAVKTLVHELAHALLHAKEAPADRSRQEVEVESVAFVVLDALGLASDGYSFPYVARWSDGDIDLVKDAAERAVSCSRQILSGLSVTGDAGLPILRLPSRSQLRVHSEETDLPGGRQSLHVRELQDINY